ncbi:MAG TPA: hypothetical protein VHZ99_03060 [Steroidobacteraceae bacterium]|jgi:hypothetical protein|nr:hypothetical protein [Steroidobacteraceae bacterium]
MNPRFRVTVGSEPEYDNLVGDLYFDDAIVCVLTQEDGPEAVRIKLFGPPHVDNWEFSLREFEEALAALKQRLWELRRTV